MALASNKEYNPTVPVYDVRHFNAPNVEAELPPRGIHVLGGFIGELIMTLSSVVDFVIA